MDSNAADMSQCVEGAAAADARCYFENIISARVCLLKARWRVRLSNSSKWRYILYASPSTAKQDIYAC